MFYYLQDLPFYRYADFLALVNFYHYFLILFCFLLDFFNTEKGYVFQGD